MTGKPYTWYLTEFGDDAEVLLDMKDNIISPILSFMNGGQRAIYDEARDFLKVQEANFQSVGYDEALQIKQTLDDPNCYRGDHIRRVKSLMDGLQAQIDTTLAKQRKCAVYSLVALHQRLVSDDRFSRLPQMRQEDHSGSLPRH